MDILNWLVFAAGAAVFWYVEYQDAKYSDLYELTTTGEANWWSRGKDGYYSLTKSLLITGGYFGLTTAFAIFTPWEYAPMFAGGFLGAAAGAIWSVVHKNVTKHEGILQDQEKILSNIARDPLNALEYLGGADLARKDDVRFWIFKPFYDMREACLISIPEGAQLLDPIAYANEKARAEAELVLKFRRLAAARILWRDKDRSRKI